MDLFTDTAESTRPHPTKKRKNRELKPGYGLLRRYSNSKWHAIASVLFEVHLMALRRTIAATSTLSFKEPSGTAELLGYIFLAIFGFEPGFFGQPTVSYFAQVFQPARCTQSLRGGYIDYCCFGDNHSIR